MVVQLLLQDIFSSETLRTSKCNTTHCKPIAMCFITHYCSCTLVYNATVCSVFCCVSFSETPRISLLLNARKLETQCIVFQCTSLCFTLHFTMQLQNIALCSAQQFNQCWDLFIALYITLSPAVRLNTHLYPQRDDFVPLVYFFEAVDFLWGWCVEDFFKLSWSNIDFNDVDEHF